MGKPKQKTLVTPVGIARFVHVFKPNTRFKKDGEYSVDLAVNPEAPGVSELLALVTDLANDAKAKALTDAENGKQRKAIEKYSVHIPIQKEVDKDGNETGWLLIKAKNSASFKGKDGEMLQRFIPIFDAKKNAMKNVKVGRGSKLRLGVVPNPYVAKGLEQAGVTFWLKAVQVLELVEWTGGDAESYGFGEEEGFTVDQGGAEEMAAVVGSEDEGDNQQKDKDDF